MKDKVIITILFSIGALVFLFGFLVGSDYAHPRGYKKGQIDALQDNIKYECVVTNKWIKIMDK